MIMHILVAKFSSISYINFISEFNIISPVYSISCCVLCCQHRK